MVQPAAPKTMDASHTSMHAGDLELDLAIDQ